MTMMRECDLRPTIDRWLCGCWVVHEYQAAYHLCDVYGVQFERRIGRRIPPIRLTIAVELKLYDIAGVLEQSRLNREAAHYSYAAMPAERVWRMRDSTLDRFRETGVGLVAVDDGWPQTWVRAARSEPQIDKWHRRTLWRRTKQFRVAARVAGGEQCQ